MPHTIAEYQPDDAPAVAAMWNASQDGWPSGFGVPPWTAETVIDDFVRPVRNLAIFLAHADGKVVGWCNLTRYLHAPNASYVGVLNVDSRYHGQGVGRDLLRAAFDRSVQLGYRRLDLHTWAGNHRALPLYKKMGFFWVPDSSVHMENYLPGLIQAPLVQEFLGQTDWYTALRQPIDLVEDDQKVVDRPIFAYYFERDGQRLRIVVDRASQEILAIESANLTAGLDVPHRLVVNGLASAWCEVQFGEQQIDALAMNGAVWTEGGIDGTALIAGATSNRRTLDVTAKQVGQGKVVAQLDIGGRPLRLVAGVEVVPQLEIAVRPRHWSMVLGQQRDFAVDVKNNTDLPVPVTLRAIANRGLTVVESPSAATIPENQTITFRVTLRAAETGSRQVELVAAPTGAAQIPVTSKSVLVLVPARGQVLAAEYDDAIVLENLALRVRIQRKGAEVHIERRHDDRPIGYASLRVGPPYRPTEIALTNWSLTAQASNGAAEVIASVDLSEFPGCNLEQRVSLSADSFVPLSGCLRNGSAEPISLDARWGTGFSWGPSAETELVMPIDGDIIRQPGINFPDWHSDVQILSRFDEPWLAGEFDGSVVGCSWDAAESLVWDGWRGMVVTGALGCIAPGETSQQHSILMWAGVGNWRVLRERWREAGVKLSAARREDSGTRVQIDPPVAILDDEETRVAAHVRGIRYRSAPARLDLRAPAGIEIRPDSVDLDRVSLTEPYDREITIRATHEESPFASEATVELRTPIDGSTKMFPIIHGRRSNRPVAIEEQVDEGRPIVALDNGWARIRVAPVFGATVFSWERDGVNQLLSAFPTSGAFAWFGPWVGGIGPAIFKQQPGFGPGQAGAIVGLHPSWQPLPEIQRCGRTWSGVRLWFRAPFASTLLVEVEYLTLPGSNLLLAVVRLRNEGGSDESVDLSLNAFSRPSGQTEALRLHWSPDRPPIQPLPHQGDAIVCGTWAAVEGQSQTLSLVSLRPDTHIQGLTAGTQTIPLFLYASPTVKPGEQYELTGIFALVPDPGTARAYRHLCGAAVI